MTKVIVLGAPTEEVKVKKPIEFTKSLSADGKWSYNSAGKPADFNYIELISLNYGNNFDLMFAYYNPEQRDGGVLFLGHFNDGVV